MEQEFKIEEKTADMTASASKVRQLVNDDKIDEYQRKKKISKRISKQDL